MNMNGVTTTSATTSSMMNAQTHREFTQQSKNTINDFDSNSN